jgi:hypothetical protein
VRVWSKPHRGRLTCEPSVHNPDRHEECATACSLTGDSATSRTSVSARIGLPQLSPISRTFGLIAAGRLTGYVEHLAENAGESALRRRPE